MGHRIHNNIGQYLYNTYDPKLNWNRRWKNKTKLYVVDPYRQ